MTTHAVHPRTVSRHVFRYRARLVQRRLRRAQIEVHYGGVMTGYAEADLRAYGVGQRDRLAVERRSGLRRWRVVIS